MRGHKATGLASLALGTGCAVYIIKGIWMALVIGVVSFSLLFLLRD